MRGRLQALLTGLVVLAMIAAAIVSAVWLKSKAALVFNVNGRSHYEQQDWDKVIHEETIAIRLNPKNTEDYATGPTPTK